MTILCVTLAFSTSSSYANSNPKYASFVMDADTGLILHQRYADKELHPASLTKMMTMLLTFEALDSGKLSMSTRVRISRHAASMIPSKLNIPAGGSIRVKDALYALATKSANDVAVALAEQIGGSETGFARLMTQRAHDIGMSRTVFRNASGLHTPKQVSTARDMAKLARYILIRYPHYYYFFSTRQFTYRGHTYNNHNKLLGAYDGVDGFKTGYVSASGFNLVASAKRGHSRIIGVVFGGRTGKSRNDHMVDLLDRGFSKLDDVRVAAAAQVPVPDRKPALLTAGAESSFTSISSLNARRAQRTRTAQAFQQQPSQRIAMDIGAFSELIGQGDYDPAVSKRLETGLLAVAVHKGDYEPHPEPSLMKDGYREVGHAVISHLGAKATQKDRAPTQETPVPNARSSGQLRNAAYTPGRWAIQIGAYTSRAHTDYALRQASAKLPDTLNRSQPLVVPLRTADGLVYRARLTGYSKSEAISACQFFKDCMTIAP